MNCREPERTIKERTSRNGQDAQNPERTIIERETRVRNLLNPEHELPELLRPGMILLNLEIRNRRGVYGVFNGTLIPIISRIRTPSKVGTRTCALRFVIIE